MFGCGAVISRVLFLYKGPGKRKTSPALLGTRKGGPKPGDYVAAVLPTLVAGPRLIHLLRSARPPVFPSAGKLIL